MRILLMSANTGGGHNAAALALKAEFEKHGNQCEMRDALSFVSGLHSGLVSSGHTYLYRYFPQLFGIGYQFEERHPPRFIYDQIALGAKHFYSFLCHFPTFRATPSPPPPLHSPSRRTRKWLPLKDLKAIGAFLFAERLCRRDFWKTAF